MKLVECVPNFSEGRNRAVIDAITREISDTEGAMLLDVDPGAATNRTVVTILGPPDAVVEAAFRAIRRAAELIDMSKHRGEHPRMGATDVCPFVPVRGLDMADCAELARRLGKRVGDELGIPVFLYEHAATKPEWKSLANVRQGEYEALPKKLQSPSFVPDFGPQEFVPRSGATAIGAREFLVAYNVNVNSRDPKLAKKIALELREKGKLKRDENGKIVRDDNGKQVWVPGRFRHVRGVGWYIEEFGRAQVSYNLTDFHVSPIHEVFDASCEEAGKLGMRVTGSEIVGLVPLEAMLAAGDHYLRKQGATRGVPESERIHAAILGMGLDDLGRFDPAEKILEYRYLGDRKGLVDRSVTGFTDELSSDSVAPGGGSVAALCGAVSAALAAMVATLTWSKKGMEGNRPAMGEIGERGQQLKAWMLAAVDRDTDAFNAVIAARRLPKAGEAQAAAREQAIEQANQDATRVPLEVLERSVECLELAGRVAAEGNPASVSDAGVAGACALACAEGAALNVRINIPSVTDAGAAREFRERQKSLLESARANAERVRALVDEILDREQG